MGDGERERRERLSASSTKTRTSDGLSTLPLDSVPSGIVAAAGEEKPSGGEELSSGTEGVRRRGSCGRRGGESELVFGSLEVRACEYSTPSAISAVVAVGLFLLIPRAPQSTAAASSEIFDEGTDKAGLSDR